MASYSLFSIHFDIINISCSVGSQEDYPAFNAMSDPPQSSRSNVEPRDKERKLVNDTAPTNPPSNRPSLPPTRQPTNQPTNPPSGLPTNPPSDEPSQEPSSGPTEVPTDEVSIAVILLILILLYVFLHFCTDTLTLTHTSFLVITTAYPTPRSV